MTKHRLQFAAMATLAFITIASMSFRGRVGKAKRAHAVGRGQGALRRLCPPYGVLKCVKASTCIALESRDDEAPP
jgi:hypothetical protein